MMCFLDKTFCKDESCACDFPKFTAELSARAEAWWNPESNPEKCGQAPVCFVIHSPKKE